MRFYMGRRIGKTHVGVSMDAGKIFQAIGYIIFSPFILTYYVCIWPVIQLVKLSKKKKAAAPARAAANTTRSTVGLPYTFQAKTWYAHKRAIMSVCRRVPAFQQSDEEFLRKHSSDRRVWQFKFTDAAGELVPEPTNEADPNAIMVVVAGQTVGYVPREETAAVRTLMRQPHEVEVSIHGGPWKRNSGGFVEVGESDFTVEVRMMAAAPTPQPAPSRPAPVVEEPEPAAEPELSVDDILSDLSWLD